MQARLTLLLGAIALLVSSLAGATLFWALKREVARQEITEVTGKFELIEHLVDMQRGARHGRTGRRAGQHARGPRPPGHLDRG